MRKLMVVALMLVGSLTYAHPTTVEEDKQVYQHIKQLLEDEVISIKTAQLMWIAYNRCCKEE